jgi:hypothetical protein
MGTVGSSGTFVNIYQITRSHVREGSNINSHWRENRKSHKSALPCGNNTENTWSEETGSNGKLEEIA